MSFTNETDKQKYYIEKCRELIAAKEQKIGRKLTACVVTFGCQMNFKDSEKLMGILSQIGYQETDDEHADLVLYNTCTVRENANLKIYGRLGYLSKIKEKNPSTLKETACAPRFYFRKRKTKGGESGQYEQSGI